MEEPNAEDNEGHNKCKKIRQGKKQPMNMKMSKEEKSHQISEES